MAAKKSATTKKKTTTTTRAASATTARKSPATPKATKTKAPAAVSAEKTKPATKLKKAPAKKALKLSDAQEKILRLIDSSGDSGYSPAQKIELRTIEKLRELKLVKKGAKDKVTGNTPYHATAAGKKHIASSSSS